MPTGTPRIIGYVRVSTEEQADSGLGLDAQERRLRAAAEFKGWDLVEVIRDEGKTGTTMAKRTGLMRALRLISSGHAEGLAVAKLDRLSRSSLDTALLAQWFRDADAQLAILDLEIDTASAMGKAVLTVLAAMAELEAGQTAERTKAALAVKRTNGGRVGRPGVHEIPTLQRRIHKLRTIGSGDGSGPWTWQRIADQLNLDGVPTLRGAELWRVSAVQTAGGYVRPPRRKARARLPVPARSRRA